MINNINLLFIKLNKVLFEIEDIYKASKNLKNSHINLEEINNNKSH